jgi:NAD(P)-dependent dehydrogenase (short-subunit alcohol dehydrogenase family)
VAFGPDGKVAVVTGASSGIGEATALRLAAAGVTVVAVARREDRLRALAERVTSRRGGRIVPHVADVTDTGQVDALAARVRDEFGACHILVNNAGVGGGGFSSRADLDDALHTLEVNLLGTVRCMAAFVDLLEASAPARVVNVASVAGKLGIGPAGYAASKFGVVGLSEALGLSWAPRGITVTQLNPGFIVTEGFPQTHLTGSPFGKLVGAPDDVAARIVEVIRTGTPERTVPSWYRAFVGLRHLAPPLYRAIAGRMERAGGERGART